MKRLSKVSLDEIRAGNYTIEEVTDAMLQLWRASGGVTILSWAKPLAVLIFTPIPGQKSLGTAFMATDAFFGDAWKPSRLLRRYLDRKMATLPGISLVSYTYSTHPELARWYRLMGYGAPTVEGAKHTFVRPPYQC
jgi:hypothetical protein